MHCHRQECRSASAGPTPATAATTTATTNSPGTATATTIPDGWLWGRLCERLWTPLPRTCTESCRYTCMHKISNEQRRRGLPAVQFHGRWPFVAHLGLDEPVSVLASLLNGVAHLGGLWALQQLHLLQFLQQRWRLRRGRQRTTRLVWSSQTAPHRQQHSDTPQTPDARRLWLGFGVVNVLAWLCSAVFHARDRPWTEALDYLAAMAVTLSAVLASLGEVGQLQGRRLAAAAAAAAAVWTAHAYHMLAVHFDYGWHVRLNCGMGLVFVATWLVFGWRSANRRLGRQAMRLALSLPLLGLLELLDFPPLLGLLDAHALWHLATVPWAIAWWRFVRELHVG